MTGRQFLLHLMVPLGIAMLAVIFEYSGLDLWWDGLFYDGAKQVWPYHDSYTASELIHVGGKKMLLYLTVVLFVLAIASNFIAYLRPHRRHLFYILIAALTGPVLVAYLKAHNHICTPWDLSVFGGSLPYVRLFDDVPVGTPIGNGFPGGHSSGGYAYISVYFAMSAMRSRYRYMGLLIPFLIGLVFSVAQEMRGAHFPSHDMFSLAICWLSALFFYLLFYRMESPKASGTSGPASGIGTYQSN